MRMVHAYMMSSIYMLISHHFDDGYVVRAQLVKNGSCMFRHFFFLPYLLS